MFRNILCLMLIIPILSSCQNIEEGKHETNKLHIAAASNFLFAFEEIAVDFEKETGTEIVFSFGSSGQLAEQIDQGAPFDVFASANVEFLTSLEKSKAIIAQSSEVFAYGQVGIAMLPEYSAKLHSIENLLHDDIKKIAIASPAHAPYGKAGIEAIEASGLSDELVGKIVYARNVSDALTYVETKNAEAAIIALSLTKPELHVIPIDSSLHKPLVHAASVISGSKMKEHAQDFINYLISEKGQSILEKYGFVSTGEQ